jgi:hypothetical protein
MHKLMTTPPRQQGAVLVVSLIFLIVLGLLGLASMGTSRIELRLANNTEARATAHQAAQALAEAVAATPAMTPVLGAAGYTVCTPGLPDCDDDSLYMPAGELADAVADGYLTGTAVMTAPTNGPPPRGLGFSADKFSATTFEVNAIYDRADAGLGSADVTQGLIVVTPVY